MFHEMAKYLFISLWIVFLNKSVTWTSNFKRICYLQLEKITTTSNKTGGKKGQNNVDWTSLFNDIEINKIVEFDGCHILEEITNNLEKHLKEENKDTDATDGVFDAITALSEEVRGGFEDLLDDDKKRFLKLHYCWMQKLVLPKKKKEKKLESQLKQASKYGQDKTNSKKTNGHLQQGK